MARFLTFFFLLCYCIAVHGQGLIGAWEAETTSPSGEPLKHVVIFADGYQALAIFNAKTNAFVSTNGGTWTLEGDLMTEFVEFHTEKPELIGTEVSFKISLVNDTLKIVDSDVEFTRIDSGAPGALQGGWLMSGRIRDGKTQMRDTSRPRKTMKLLSGTRFQWIAYNIETKQFMGTGGGTYTTHDGIYTEHIEFFSRDNTKAGMSLKFDYKIEDGQWHHKGFSSKGDPMHEIWSVRNK